MTNIDMDKPKLTVQNGWAIALGQKQTFNDWIMQEMVPHGLGRTTLFDKSVLPITMIFSVISFLEKS